MGRLFGIGENRLVGVERHGIEARNGRHRGARASGDDKEFGPHLMRGRPHQPPPGKCGAFLDHLNAEPGEPFHRIMRGDGGDDVRHMAFHRGEIDHRGRPGDSHRRIAVRVMRGLGRRQQRL